MIAEHRAHLHGHVAFDVLSLVQLLQLVENLERFLPPAFARRSGGQIVDEGFDMWTSDGVEILNDTPPPATGNVCLGTWVKIAPNTYLLKHPSWTFDDAGNLNGTAIIRETIVLDPSGSTYKGTFTVDVLTLSGSEVQHLSGTLTGTRITVD